MKFFSLLLALFLTFGLQAQFIDGGIEGLRLLTKVSDDMNKIEGSPYWNEDFKFGTINIKDKAPIKAFLRYDVRSEIVEIKVDPSSEEIYILGNRPNVTYTLDGKNIIADKISSEGRGISGLFVEHYKGDKYRLLEKSSVEISDPVQAKSSYESDKPAQMKISSDFYIISNGTAEEVRIKHRDIKKMFSSKAAKKYLSDNRIRETEDLVAFLSFLEDKPTNN